MDMFKTLSLKLGEINFLHVCNNLNPGYFSDLQKDISDQNPTP